MRIGDKFEQGYRILSQGGWEGVCQLYGAVCDLSMLDEIDATLFDKLQGFVAAMSVSEGETEANQWIKCILLDKRYSEIIMRPGDLLENLRNQLNELPEIEENGITERFLDGVISKVKYLNGAFFYIQYNEENKLGFLVRSDNEGTIPLDFDVDEFQVNRQNQRIEFSYIRGSKDWFGINPDGTDKRVITGVL